ncbi:MAG: hypothetical protein M1836_003200 [Candelina mexicana]|nr:MAG: hypothetical protein M1836_003200 [Candelina mexicana]
MFSSALKSFTSNISANYTLSPNPVSTSGPWKIFDAKKKNTGKDVSVFSFDRKSLDPQSGGLGGRSGAASIKKAHEEVIERLKKEASSLARLRHPNILELAEPVEETRNGGLMFATEPVTASLAGLLREKEEQERAGGIGGRTSRYVVEEAQGGGRRRREIEIDELEIQKGLLQIGKGLEFLHESAGLVHANLTPEAIYINAKSDWKISGLGFSTPLENSNTATSIVPISLAEVLNYDPRLPRSVQLNLDFTSPDFVLDSNITPAADLFSLGLLIVALYNCPHTSPLQTSSSASNYRRLIDSSSSTPSQSNNYLSAKPIPKELVSSVLPRLIARRPAQRLTAREFQTSQYFDNILVSTIRWLDSLPAHTPNEKAQFMRGLPRVLGQFPKSILDRKVLPAILEEMKDRELLSLVLLNVFQIIKMMPSGRRAFTEKVIPRLREVFAPTKATTERDTGKEAGLMVVLENIAIVTGNCSGKEFKDDILPIIHTAIESPTHSLVDKSMRCLSAILPVLDFSTIKNELFPVVANVFSKTSSLGIKVRGLEAFVILCGGGSDEPDTTFGDDKRSKKAAGSAALDKYTIQEKVIPLLKAIKTKEPAVMMAALSVFQQVGKIADSDFLAMDVLPVLWSFSLGPLLNLQQFREYMSLIKSISSKIEEEQTKKLEELSSNSVTTSTNPQRNDIMSFGAEGFLSGSNGLSNGEAGDFERLVLGKHSSGPQSDDMLSGGWNASSSSKPQIRGMSSHQDPHPGTPVFSWSTPSAGAATSNNTNAMAGALSSQTQPASRAITPDQSLSIFPTLAPASGAGSSLAQPLQPTNSISPWSTSIPPSSTTSHTMNGMSGSMANIKLNQPLQLPSQAPSGFRIPPPPLSSNSSYQPQLSTAHTTFSAFNIPPPPARPQPRYGAALGASTSSSNPGAQIKPSTTQPNASQKQGLDAFESLL